MIERKIKKAVRDELFPPTVPVLIIVQQRLLARRSGAGAGRWRQCNRGLSIHEYQEFIFFYWQSLLNLLLLFYPSLRTGNVVTAY